MYLSLLVVLPGQPASDSGPAFEVADIHPSPSTTNQFMRGGFYRGGRYEVRTATLVDLIRTAYGLDTDDKVSGGPGWLTKDRFDIVAKAPANSNVETLRGMLRNLLADRFKLVVHEDTKPLAAYAVTQGKKLQLKPGDQSGESGCKLQPQPEPPPGTGGGRLMMSNNGVVSTFIIGAPLVYNCRNMTMAAFAEALKTMTFVSNGYLNNNNRIVDQTELQGVWNFDVKYTLRLPGLIRQNQENQPESITIFDALEKQLGLKLELTKVPLPVIAVDSVNEKPTDNLPGITEKMPEPPTEFEVATIKPSGPPPPPGTGFVPLFQPGGRINISRYTLKNLINLAWGSNGPAPVVEGGPKFIETDQWDIVAKATTGSSLNSSPDGSPQAQQVDIDSMRVMLQNLLKDRFKLQVHLEHKPLPGYALIAVKPKLKTADSSNRPGCTEGPGPDGKDPRVANPAASRLITCLNTSVADFAAQLPIRANGYFGQQFPGGLVDETKLEGNYDITINFSVAGMASMGGGGRGGDAGPGGVGVAQDPGGGITLQEALEKQLGLKMEPRKNPGPVLVIDHVEQTPTDN
jgi:uncharacterized protein (TIGR03435 family)